MRRQTIIVFLRDECISASDCGDLIPRLSIERLDCTYVRKTYNGCTGSVHSAGPCEIGPLETIDPAWRDACPVLRFVLPGFPKSVAAHRWQMWLLVTALLAILVTAFLVVDLTRNLRTVVISDTNKALTNAVQELQQFRQRARLNPDDLARRDRADAELQKISYEVLSSYPDIEGGYLLDDKVIGHSFPTYTEPGSTLYQPVLEHQEVLSALAESKQTGKVARRVVQDRKDLVLVAVLASPDSTLSAWSLRRILNFSDSSELTKRYLLVIVMFVSLISIGIVLRLSLGLQREFATDPDRTGEAANRPGLSASGSRRRTPHHRASDQQHGRTAGRNWKLRCAARTGSG